MRKLVLGIPAQASGKNLTRPLMPSAPQTSCVRATSPHHRKLGAGYVALPQMTGRRFGKPFILSPPTLALRFRQNNGPTPSGDYQPSRSLSMAGSGKIIRVKIIRVRVKFNALYYSDRWNSLPSEGNVFHLRDVRSILYHRGLALKLMVVGKYKHS